jgi:hypothetical protein
MSLDEWGSLGAAQQAIEDAVAGRAAARKLGQNLGRNEIALFYAIRSIS